MFIGQGLEGELMRILRKPNTIPLLLAYLIWLTETFLQGREYNEQSTLVSIILTDIFQ